MEELETRLAAVERALADGEADPEFAEAAAVDGRLDDVETAVAELRDRVDDLAGDLQAVRGSLGGTGGVDDATERRVEAALARLETLERQFTGRAGGVPAEEELADVTDTQRPVGGPGGASEGCEVDDQGGTGARNGNGSVGRDGKSVADRSVGDPSRGARNGNGAAPPGRRRDPGRQSRSARGRRGDPGADDSRGGCVTDGEPAPRSDGPGGERPANGYEPGACVRCGRGHRDGRTGSGDRSGLAEPVDGTGTPHPAADADDRGLLGRLLDLV
jgi:hypothetical protein